MSVGRWLRTVGALKPQQVAGRVAFRLARPRPNLTATPPAALLPRALAPPVPRSPCLIGPDVAVFLNERASIRGAGAWNDPALAHLWLYNLHYFDDLAAGDCDAVGLRAGLIRRWICENPPGRGVGWEPYPTSLRIVNWTKWALAGRPFDETARHSLAVQLRWLSERLEHHLLGNHLLANAKALVFGGLYFGGPEAGDWRARGLAILDRQLPEQILGDGGHFERSTMYHAIVLEDLLDLINIGEASGLVGGRLETWRDAASRMLAWLEAMSHPDGRIAFFNDAAFDIAAEPDELTAYAARLGVPLPPAARAAVTRLDPSGYIRLQAGEAVALLDAAPVGPSYLPGHAHADTLSFELSLGPERIIVNGGASLYDVGRQRQAERGTATHSTVQIANQDSSEVWASFRVGRRARVSGVEAGADARGAQAAAHHDGYRHLKGRPTHHRSWRLESERLLVHDRISTDIDAVARFHFPPGAAVQAAGDGLSGLISTVGGRPLIWRVGAPARVEQTPRAVAFGRRLAAPTLVVPLVGRALDFELSW